MPVLNIGGRKIKVGDDFLKLSPEQQNATVEEIAATLPKVAAPAAAVAAEAPEGGPTGLTDIVRPLATGVPIIGGLLNQANAATNAALAPIIEPFLEKGPDTLDQPTFGERRKRSLEIQNARDKKFADENPILDPVLKVTGGVAGTIPAVVAAPALMGAAGTLPQMIKAGAASGGLINAADAAVRGEDVPTAAAIGLGAGAGAPLVGRAVGAIARAVRPGAAPVQQNTVRVGDRDIPVSASELSGDAVQAGEEQAILAGGRGENAQRLAQEWQAGRDAEVEAARAGVAASLDPSGAVPRTAPQAAGGRVVDEVAAREAQRVALERQATEAVEAEGARLRGGLAPGAPVVDSPYSAAEAVGAGVARERDAAVSRTRELYDRLKSEPGAFDPEVPQGLSANIRARLNKGDDPLWVDPDTTSVANSALKVIDETVGNGLFKNAAAARTPVGPVAQAAVRGGDTATAPIGAATAAPQSEAAATLDELVRMGINPARARAAVADIPGGEVLTSPALKPHSVSLPDGRSVDVAPKVVEAASLRTSADSGYDQALQPRNRARAASDAQINDISKNLNPERLGLSSEADRGAPIVGADAMVESGNGRVLALRQAYAENGPAAAKYREWLQSQGVDVSKFREPVLVRERATPMTPAERKAFTVSANQSSTLSLSAPERALADARALTPESLSLIRNPADLGALDNRDFVRSFMNGVPQAERGALMTASGDLSSEGLTRVRNAMLAKAYGDTPILARIAESTKDDVKSISNALVEAAPEWAALRGAIASGQVPAELDATAHLIDAVARTARIRAKGVGLEDSLAQADAFAAQSDESKALQRLFYSADGEKAAPSSQVSSALRHYAQEARKVDASPGLDFGLPPVTARDILETTAKAVGAPKELAKSVTEAAERAAAPAAAAGDPIPEVGLREMDAARKRLVTMYGDARRAAMGPGGSGADERAMRRILQEFDNSIVEAFEAGRFSGDSDVARALLKDARASHAQYRQTFTNRGGADPVGRSVEKILGRYADTAATPAEIAKLSYGSVSDPGGDAVIKVAQRLKSILGDTSPEWGAYKQGLVSHLIDTPAGGAALSPAKAADRIDKFLSGTQGRGLAQVAFSADERTALKRFADNLRASEPAPMPAANTVDGMMARIAGRDGRPAATPDDVVKMLMSSSGRTSKVTVPLAARLKTDLSPEGWTSVRQGMWERLTNAGEGKIAFGPQALSQRISEFLNESGSGLSKMMYSASERAQMAQLAKVYSQMIPVKGSTNPSGTAPMLARIANKASSNLLAMLGGVQGGFAGLAAGAAADRALRAVGDAKGVRSAVRGFYGQQPKMPVRTSRVPIVLTQGASPQANQR